MNLVDILSVGHIALKLIQARLVTILALVGTFALFAWAMWLQTALGAMIAVSWGLSIFLPVLYAGRGGSDAVDSKGRPEQGADEPAGRSADGA